jgi:alkaline phosphatase
MEYDIDRNNTSQPSLSEMTEKALDILTNSAGEKGFYLMIEGSRIDMAGHV